MSITVRAALAVDAAAIARVHVDSWRTAYRGLVPDDHLAALSIERREIMWRELLSGPSDPNAGTLVAERDGAVVGFVSTGPSRDADADATTGEVLALHVTPHAWSTGAGRALMTAAFARFRHAGHRIVTLWVLRGNERAIRFYEQAGFGADGATQTEDHGETKLEELRYRASVPHT